jgi:hypothetical protein
MTVNQKYDASYTSNKSKSNKSSQMKASRITFSILLSMSRI